MGRASHVTDLYVVFVFLKAGWLVVHKSRETEHVLGRVMRGEDSERLHRRQASWKDILVTVA